MSSLQDVRPGTRGGVLFSPETAPFPLPRRAPGPDDGWVRVGPAGRSVREIERGFAASWRDAPWPARPWQVLARADEQGVDLATRAALLVLPARTYRSAAEVAAALADLPPAWARRRP
ncbi:hypothetical protein [Actinomycetospora sp. CA-084318]|uniref:DUF2795 domain-containing protein n=1 Tax=Actinomycetospora sp. CA-084318 TaxID=3239892 RepID=UPI003D9A01FB